MFYSLNDIQTASPERRQAMLDNNEAQLDKLVEDIRSDFANLEHRVANTKRTVAWNAVSRFVDAWNACYAPHRKTDSEVLAAKREARKALMACSPREVESVCPTKRLRSVLLGEF